MNLLLRVGERDGWITAEVENRDGDLLGRDVAAVVGAATFDVRGVVIRAAVEKALIHLRRGPVDV